MKVISKLLSIVIVIAVLSGCKKDDAPVAPSSKTVDVKKYVAIGNSLTAGYQSGGLYRSAQVNGFANLIAGKLKDAKATIGTFEIPYWEDPGSYGSDGKSSRLVLKSFEGPVITTEGKAPGVQSNLSLQRPYDNLGIPGAIIYDFLDTTDFIAKSSARQNPFFGHVLRQAALGKSIFYQAVALNPDLITFWLGNNDVLGFATSGGTALNMVGQTSPTPTSLFTQMYNGSLGALRGALPNAKIVVANIPDVKAVPYFTTIGPKIAAGLPTGVYARYQQHGNTGAAFDSTRFTEANAPFFVLAGSAYASLVGTPSGKWYKDNASKYPSLPAGIDTTKPFGVYPTNPIPDALVLDATEQATAQTAITEFNGIIASAAVTYHANVLDVNTFFNNIKANGITIGGVKYTTDFITGQLFSLDGVHPSSKGQGIVANEFIKVMNSKYFDNALVEVDVASLPGITVSASPLGKYQAKMISQKTYPEWKSFLDLWQ